MEVRGGGWRGGGTADQERAGARREVEVDGIEGGGAVGEVVGEVSDLY